MSRLDDEALKRFLCGRATEEERAAIERLLETEMEERVTALEDELIRDYIHGSLDERWRRPLEECFDASPARRRRMEETAALMKTMRAITRDEVPVRAPRRSLSRTMLTAAAAVVVAASVVGGWLLTRRERVSGTAPRTVAALVLTSSVKGAEAPQQTIVRRSGVDDIALAGRIAIDMNGLTRLSASVRRVGGGAVAVPTVATFERTPAAIDLRWTIPAAGLPAGDYIVTVKGETSGGPSETIQEWFFSVVD